MRASLRVNGEPEPVAAEALRGRGIGVAEFKSLVTFAGIPQCRAYENGSAYRTA